ncbi:ABC transporter permease [Bifidobacterium pseudolongum subsp. globosum]|uniref:ABC transporter permease n=1 Tax=Bifidobacterium pseudolongum subsp. globosum TaxID=1690 RepID=A0A2N3QYV9_9BIFI|nr:ABC transporter permease [Bifidobacterium pseudolongum]MEE0653933.1 ABC transporter permease [Bifidobacterium criceti]PKU94145.1 ABC transporter permease [Bifidobacterium pseudolongum subsp. globosum]PKU98420.1 ABC transporter permease [Bifidobacterium pseudolongum subsp. globosum]PKV03882.1 ABC transporter permease [Bifidobacterium pseudolongum subsp. globosum]RYP98743.1 ABC transporter permease [Bifidobacterium pseudolongum subsp. globosum]
MFFMKTVLRSVRRQWRRRLLIALTVALSATVSVAMLGIVFDVQDKLSAELAAYGSNITVRAKSDAVVADLYETMDGGAGGASTGALLDEADAQNVKTIFWAYNITNFAPRLDTNGSVRAQGAAVRQAPVVGTWFAKRLQLETGESAVAGMAGMRSWWKLDGRWPNDGTAEAVVGAKLAKALGVALGDTAQVTVSREGRDVPLTIVGVYTSNDSDDGAIYTSTASAQRLADAAGKIGQIEVKALTTPENDLARRAAKNPAMLSQEEWETWYCTAYASSIAYQLEEAIPGAVARQVRQVGALQSDVMTKTRAIMVVMTALCLVAAAVAVANLMAAAIAERSGELALLKAVGAGDGAVARLLLAETLLVAFAGLVVGAAAGLGVAQLIGHLVFGTGITARPLVLLLVCALIVVSVLAASVASMCSVIRLQPAQVLHGR